VHKTLLCRSLDGQQGIPVFVDVCAGMWTCARSASVHMMSHILCPPLFQESHLACCFSLSFSVYIQVLRCIRGHRSVHTAMTSCLAMNRNLSITVARSRIAGKIPSSSLKLGLRSIIRKAALILKPDHMLGRVEVVSLNGKKVKERSRGLTKKMFYSLKS
jgi:hypothetical protein